MYRRLPQAVPEGPRGHGLVRQAGLRALRQGQQSKSSCERWSKIGHGLQQR